MEKIYSRKRIKIPKVHLLYKNSKEPNCEKIRKVLKITCVMVIASITEYVIMQAISHIINKQCINIAKSIATKISNEQATAVMSKYKYEDLCNITKDNNREYYNDKCKCYTNK